MEFVESREVGFSPTRGGGGSGRGGGGGGGGGDGLVGPLSLMGGGVDGVQRDLSQLVRRGVERDGRHLPRVRLREK